MKQHEFIWIIKNTCPESEIVQNDTGVTSVTLRPGVEILHTYKKKDSLTVKLLDSKTEYIIPNKKSLEDVIRLHLGNVNLNQILNQHCEESFKKN